MDAATQAVTNAHSLCERQNDSASRQIEVSIREIEDAVKTIKGAEEDLVKVKRELNKYRTTRATLLAARTAAFAIVSTHSAALIPRA